MEQSQNQGMIMPVFSHVPRWENAIHLTEAESDLKEGVWHDIPDRATHVGVKKNSMKFNFFNSPYPFSYQENLFDYTKIPPNISKFCLIGDNIRWK